MATVNNTETATELALAFQPSGFEEIPASTILTRLNYYDGKFLRADDLRLEQDYGRRLAELGARAGGAGLVYGFDVFMDSGDLVTIGRGLGFDAAGRVLYLPGSFSIGLQTLVDLTAQASAQAFLPSEGASGFAVCAPDTAPTTPTASNGAEFYVISIAHAEDACGDEEVFGKLCDDGCATSTDRSYLVEGIIARARPFRPATPFATSRIVQLTELHIRSQLASAAFADDWLTVPSQISKAGLLSGPWCTGAAAPTGWEVPIAIVGILSSTSFVDEWIVRRERMDTPPRRYWAWSMAMRPWEAFLAQVLQFQCQLPSALGGRGGDATLVDPCGLQRDALGEAVRYIDQLHGALAMPSAGYAKGAAELNAMPDGKQAPPEPPAAAVEDAQPLVVNKLEHGMSMATPSILSEVGGITRLRELQMRLGDAYRRVTIGSQRILVDGGIVELPPAGYLPVTPGTTPPVDVQVRRLLGDGVDLRFCVTTPDYIPHALETAQHMDRISLLQGLDNPANKPPVDVLVPNGILGTVVKARGWDATVAFYPWLLSFSWPSADSIASVGLVEALDIGATYGRLPAIYEFHGVGRSAPAAGGGWEVAFAGPGSAQYASSKDVGKNALGLTLAGYVSATFDADPFALDVGGSFNVSAQAAYAVDATTAARALAEQRTGLADASFTVQVPAQSTGAGLTVTATGTLKGSDTWSGDTTGTGTAGTDVSLQITRNDQTSPSTYEVAVTPTDPASTGEVLLRASWQGSPTTVEAAGELETTPGDEGTPPSAAAYTSPADVVGLTETPVAVPSAAVKLIENADVFSSSNALNVSARQALQMLSNALDDPQYVGTLATNLFNPNAAGGDATGITATLDWVMFHRRRHKDCQTPQAPPVATKNYGVFVADLPEPAAFKSVIAAVMEDDPSGINQAEIRPAGIATFAAGTATLASPANVLAAWKNAFPFNMIMGAVIATNETDETVSLLKNRVLAYQSAVASVSKPRANEQFHNRQMLASLPSGGVDGQFILLTVATICHHVYAVTDGGAQQALNGLLHDATIDTYFADYGDTLTDLGTMTFADNTSTFEASTLPSWDSTGFEQTVFDFFVISQSGVSPNEPWDAQATEIVQTLGATVGYEGGASTASEPDTVVWPMSAGPCPVISLLVARVANAIPGNPG